MQFSDFISQSVTGEAKVSLSNLEVDLNPKYNIWGKNPNHIVISADIYLQSEDVSTFAYEVLNSRGQRISLSIHPRTVKPNTKENFKIGIDQPSKNAYFPDGYYLLRTWAISTWTGRRFDWKIHTGIKEYKQVSNTASIELKKKALLAVI